MGRLLIVSHSRSGSTERLVDAVAGGAAHPEIDGVSVDRRDALATDADVVARADAVILATPENFGYMSGALKMFLEEVYHPLLEREVRRPWALLVKAGNDGSGAVSSVERIVAGLRWPPIRPPLVVRGDIEDDDLEAAAELGAQVAAGIEFGLW